LRAKFNTLSGWSLLGCAILIIGFARPALAQTPEANAPSLNPDYELAPGDVIDLQFFYNPELNEKVQIRPDGRISLSLVGEVELARKTVPAAVKELETAYRKVLKTPSIRLQVAGYSAQKVFVGGEVTHAGPVNMPGDLTVLQAVMEAGGPLHSASTKELILIRRDDQGLPYIQRLSLQNGKDTPSEAVTTRLRPYDVVLVPESGISKADRWVDNYLRKLDPAFLTAGFNFLASTHFIP
jgi:protein involved in polysaccharide export with SLBB domain